MCKEVEKYTKKVINKAIDDTKDNLILKMLIRGKMTVQEIAEDCAVTLEHVTSIAKKNNIAIA